MPTTAERIAAVRKAVAKAYKAALERADKGLMHSKQLKVSEALVPLVTKAHRLQINDQAMRYWVMHQYTLWHPGAQEDVLNHAFEDAVRRVNGK